jgi:hypothetical protein
MFISPKKHILSNTILIAALIRAAEFLISGILRTIRRQSLLMIKPDGPSGLVSYIASESGYSRIQTVLSLLTVILTAVTFIYALKKTGAYMALIPKEDREDLARLQEEVFGENNSALSAETVRKLLRIWFAILVGAQIMYDISAGLYSSFTGYLSLATAESGDVTGAGYAFLYNLTHGFKYQGMLVALLLGIVVTAIFLSDRSLKLIAYTIAVLFIISSMGMEMAKVTLLGDTLGMVWSSVIFHAMNTIGLAAFAIYMRVRYKGV